MPPQQNTASAVANARCKVAVMRSGESPTYSAQPKLRPRVFMNSMTLGMCLSWRLPDMISSPMMMRPKVGVMGRLTGSG